MAETFTFWTAQDGTRINFERPLTKEEAQPILRQWERLGTVPPGSNVTHPTLREPSFRESFASFMRPLQEFIVESGRPTPELRKRLLGIEPPPGPPKGPLEPGGGPSEAVGRFFAETIAPTEPEDVATQLALLGTGAGPLVKPASTFLRGLGKGALRVLTPPATGAATAQATGGEPLEAGAKGLAASLTGEAFRLPSVFRRGTTVAKLDVEDFGKSVKDLLPDYALPLETPGDVVALKGALPRFLSNLFDRGQEIVLRLTRNPAAPGQVKLPLVEWNSFSTLPQGVIEVLPSKIRSQFPPVVTGLGGGTTLLPTFAKLAAAGARLPVPKLPLDDALTTLKLLKTAGRAGQQDASTFGFREAARNLEEDIRQTLKGVSPRALEVYNQIVGEFSAGKRIEDILEIKGLISERGVIATKKLQSFLKENATELPPFQATFSDVNQLSLAPTQTLKDLLRSNPGLRPTRFFNIWRTAFRGDTLSKEDINVIFNPRFFAQGEGAITLPVEAVKFTGHPRFPPPVLPPAAISLPTFETLRRTFETQ